jgi:hypothetical protein
MRARTNSFVSAWRSRAWWSPAEVVGVGVRGKLAGMGRSMRAVWDGQAVARHRQEVVIDVLDDPALWGGPIRDERYLIHSPR